jgi:hypothetical protein
LSLAGQQMPRALLLAIHHSKALSSWKIPQGKLFSILSQSLARARRCPGTVGTPLALLLIEQMLKRF